MTCSYRTCGNGLPTARLPERSESVRLSGTLCRVLAVLAVTGVRRRHPVARADAPGPGRAEAHHHGPPGRLGHQGRRRRWPGRRRCPFRPGRVPAGPLPLLRLSSAPRKQRSGAERTAARGHRERTQTRSGQRAGRRRPRSRPGARGGGPVRRLREGGPSSPTHRASARDRRRVHRRPSRHLQGRPGPGGPDHSGPRRRTMPATYADRRLRAMPRPVAPGLSRPRSEQAPYRRLCLYQQPCRWALRRAQNVRFWLTQSGLWAPPSRQMSTRQGKRPGQRAERACGG
jgi:hypothetical protein